MGEELSPSPDSEIIRYIDLANIACAGHAGSNQSMQETIRLAKQHQVAIGAHPSYPDRAHFGRQVLDLSWSELEQHLSEQFDTLQQHAIAVNLPIHHIKPHGALYLEMMRCPSLFENLLAWQKNIAPNCQLMMQANVNQTRYLKLANAYQINILKEAFADRAYLPNNQLVPRNHPNSLHNKSEDIVAQSLKFINNQFADTLCFHSDNPASVKALKKLPEIV